MSTTVDPETRPPCPPPGPPQIDLVMPVRNEADTLERSCIALARYLGDQSPVTWRITIADGASTDDTWAVATRLARHHPGVVAVRLARKGRGRALRAVWMASRSPIVACVDRSTDLPALVPLVAPLLSAQADLTIGSRRSQGAGARHGRGRALLSRVYNRLLRAALDTGFGDARCGVRAVRAEAAAALLPLVRSDAWFFDTELLVLAERCGLRIAEVPVDRVRATDAPGDVIAAIVDGLSGLWRLARASRSEPRAPAPHDRGVMAPPPRPDGIGRLRRQARCRAHRPRRSRRLGDDGAAAGPLPIA